MKNRLSAVLDAEHLTSELDGVCAALSDAELRRDWADYLLIGDALRAETKLGFDISAKVMATLENEPTVFAPRTVSVTPSAPQTRWFQQMTALAASLAGVMLVAWVTLTFSVNETMSPTTQIAVAAPVIQPANQLASAPSDKLPDHLQDYIVAHQAHSSAGTLAGGSRNVRAVSATRGVP